jgi:hypothetical protein
LRHVDIPCLVSTQELGEGSNLAQGETDWNGETGDSTDDDSTAIAEEVRGETNVSVSLEPSPVRFFADASTAPNHVDFDLLAPLEGFILTSTPWPAAVVHVDIRSP